MPATPSEIPLSNFVAFVLDIQMVVLYLPMRERISEAYSRTAIFIPLCNRFSMITLAKIDAFDYKTMIFHY